MNPVPEAPAAAQPPPDFPTLCADVESRIGRIPLTDEDILILAAASIAASSTFMERGYR